MILNADIDYLQRNFSHLDEQITDIRYIFNRYTLFRDFVDVLFTLDGKIDTGKLHILKQDIVSSEKFIADEGSRLSVLELFFFPYYGISHDLNKSKLLYFFIYRLAHLRYKHISNMLFTKRWQRNEKEEIANIIVEYRKIYRYFKERTT